MKKPLEESFYLSGHSLLYSILLTLLVSGLLSGYLLAEHALHLTVVQTVQPIRENDQLKSSLFQYLAGLLPEPEDGVFATESWGVFALVKGTLPNGTHLAALVGQTRPPASQQGLWLAGEGRALYVAGETVLSGSLQLPEEGIQYAQTPLPRFTGQITTKQIPNAQKDFPLKENDLAISQDILASIRSSPPSDYWSIWDEQVLEATWDSLPLVLQHTGNLRLDAVQAQGQVQLIVEGVLQVSANAALHHTVLIAKEIIFEKGFRGNVQAFATDTLIGEQGSYFRYPSVLAVVAQSERPGFLSLHTGSVLEGTLLYTGDPSSSFQAQVSLPSGVRIWGEVMVEGNLHLQAEVAGHVATKRFVLLTDAGRFRNLLLDARILPDRRAPAFAGPFFFSGMPKRMVALLAAPIYAPTL